MYLKFLPPNTWLVVKIAATIKEVSIHATREEAMAECQWRNDGRGGRYRALLNEEKNVRRLPTSLGCPDLEYTSSIHQPTGEPALRQGSRRYPRPRPAYS